MEIFDRSMYPALANNPELVYMDHAATSPVHQKVLDRMNRYYEQSSATAGRGEYPLAEQTLMDIDVARGLVAQYFEVAEHQVLFTTGATQGLNMVANWFRDVPQVIITQAEHNANIVPWLAQGRTVDNGRLAVVPLANYQKSNREVFQQVIERAPKGSFMSITARSNVTGEHSTRDAMIQVARAHNIRVCVDSSQDYIDPTKTRPRADFEVVSAHKMGGPKGIGALIIRDDPEKYRPQIYGGSAVDQVTFNGFTLADGTDRHEPGTPNIANILGFGSAMRLMSLINPEEHKAFTHKNSSHAQKINRVMSEFGYELAVPYFMLHNIMAFVPPRGSSSADLAMALSRTDLAIRTGRLCAHPYADSLSGGRGIVRFSTGLYTTENDYDRASKILRETLHKLHKEKT